MRILTLLLLFVGIQLSAQVRVSGTIQDSKGQLLDGMVFIDEGAKNITTDKGAYELILKKGSYTLVAFVAGYRTTPKSIKINGKPIIVNFTLEELEKELAAVTIQDQREEDLGITWLESVSGSAIYEAKKTELIPLSEIIGNKASNVSRQIYARVPGLNIWESDGAGLQLGIGGRGLDPNRTSNFNVRQNGYDISADALGYPESYYTPPVLALDKIEIVRGAAGLQYGTQFGGLLNFEFKEGPADKKVDVNLINSLGSFGLFNSFTSVGGTVGKVNYYGFYQYKTSNGWRPNSSVEQHTAFVSAKYQFSPFASLKLEQTHMNYTAQQPGGLTDVEFYQNPIQSKRERNWFEVDWNLFAAELDYRFSPNFKINNRTFVLGAGRSALGNLSRIDRPDDPTTDRDLIKDRYNNWGNEFRAIFHYPLLGQKSILLIGNRYYQGKTERMQGNGSAGFDADFRLNNPEEPQDSDFLFPSRNVSFFAENIFNVFEKFSITPGIRYEYILTEAEGYYFDRREDLAGNILYENRVEERKSNNRSFALFGVGLSYKVNDGLETYANWSQNFRSINFNDIRVNNPSLKVDSLIDDERGYNFDIGIRGSKKGLYRFDVSGFFLSYNGRIGAILRTEPDPRFNNLVDRSFRFRTNIADANILGLESYGEISLTKLFRTSEKYGKLNAFVNLALIHSRYISNDENGVEGNQVELVPPMNLKTGLTYRWKDLAVSYIFSSMAMHFSDAANTDNNPPVPTAVEGTIPAYMVMDLSASYQWKYVTLESGINNLTNAYYFTRRAAGYPGPGIIPSDGRSVYFSVGLNF